MFKGRWRHLKTDRSAAFQAGYIYIYICIIYIYIHNYIIYIHIYIYIGNQGQYIRPLSLQLWLLFEIAVPPLDILKCFLIPSPEPHMRRRYGALFVAGSDSSYIYGKRRPWAKELWKCSPEFSLGTQCLSWWFRSRCPQLGCCKLVGHKISSDFRTCFTDLPDRKRALTIILSAYMHIPISTIYMLFIDICIVCIMERFGGQGGRSG